MRTPEQISLAEAKLVITANALRNIAKKLSPESKTKLTEIHLAFICASLQYHADTLETLPPF